MKYISSTQNPLIKRLLQLKEKPGVRKKTGTFVIEGFREITLALKSGYVLEKLFFQREIVPENSVRDLLGDSTPGTELIELSKQAYQKIAYRGTTEGIIAVSRTKELLLSGLELKRRDPLILVAEAPEKPGNIGALLRTADAAGMDAVIIANPRTDMYNPNIIRASMGGIFTTHIATGSTPEIIRFLKEKQIALFCAALTASENYCEVDFNSSCAIIVGTEAEGLSREWLDNSTKNIRIPMQGALDSMNVSAAAAILIFEAKRQRGFRD